MKLHRLGRLFKALVSLVASLCFVGNSIAQTVTYFHNDPLGSPRVATDASGNVLWKEDYRPYGTTLINLAPAGSNKVGFAGASYDSNIALSYMGERYYDPVISRFTGVDPENFRVTNVHSFNRYAYANNNPYRYIDRDGRDTEELAPVVIIGSAAGAMACPWCALAAVVVLGGGWILSSQSGGKANSTSAAAGSNSASLPPGGPDDEGSKEGEKKAKRVTNPKHHPNSQSPEPYNAEKLYENSIVDKNGVRWAKDANGTVHRFSKPSNGESHWNGSTSGVDPIKAENIPIEIRRALSVKG